MGSFSYADVADTVARRAATLLAARVRVVDEHDVLVTRAEPPDGVPTPTAPRQPWRPELRLPVRLGGRRAQVIVDGQAETISARLAQALIELVLDQADTLAALPTPEDLRGKLVRDLLAGNITDEAETLREAQVLGMDLTRPRAVLLIDASEYILAATDQPERGDETASVRRAREVIRQVVRFFNLPNAAICSYLGDGEVAILKASSSRDLAPWSGAAEGLDAPAACWANLKAQKRAARALLSWLNGQTGTSVALGVGRHHAGMAGLARSWRDAQAALSLGRRLGLTGGVYSLDDLGAAAFVGVSDHRTRLELAVRLLSPLDAEPELLTTLQVFFEQNCSPSKTALQLAIHRNTLGYRLDKVTSLTGLDPRHFDDAIQMRLALILRTCEETADIAHSAASPHHSASREDNRCR
jgi:carbohydrate diacid regulator